MKRVSLIGKGKAEAAPAPGGGVNTFFAHNAHKPAAPAPARKKKLLFTLPAETAEKLTDIYLELQMKRRMLDKSEIVTLALNTLFEDFKNKKENSVLYKHTAR
ncbi:MAG TPA: hypothetical protein DER10_01165 [Elusimicrobia bacterium]|nr:hypothetical protein [Elusimicrobiota bacterium]